MTHYKTLGVAPDASLATIKAAYRRLQLAKIEVRGKRVKRKKAGHDIYAAVVATKSRELNAKIEGGEGFLKLTDMAMTILDDYEYNDPGVSSENGVLIVDGKIVGRWA